MPLVERIVAEHDVLVSVDTYKPEVAEAAVAAGAGDGQRRLGPARPGARRRLRAHRRGARDHAHARRAEGDAARSRRLRRRGRATSSASWPSAWRSRARAGWGSEQIVLDPGPDFAKTPAQTVAVLRRLDARARARAPAAARGLAQGLPRRDHGPRGRATGAPATLAALAAGRRRRGEHPARARRRRGGRLPRRPGGAARRARARARDGGPHARPLPGRASLLRARLPAAEHNAAGRRPTHTEEKETSMSSVLDPSALAESPLADLHLLANELGVDGFRRLRKADLIDAIVAKQAGEDYVAPSASGRRRRGDDADAETDGDDATPRARAADAAAAGPRPRPRRGRGPRTEPRSPAAVAGPRRGRGRRRPSRRSRGGRGGRGGREEADRPEAEDKQVEGVDRAARQRLGVRAPHRRARPPTTTSTSPPPRSSAASSSPATRSPARCARRGARSASRRSCAWTRSTASPPTRSPRAPASTTCP